MAVASDVYKVSKQGFYNMKKHNISTYNTGTENQPVGALKFLLTKK